jgi:hypothetical protein
LADVYRPGVPPSPADPPPPPEPSLPTLRGLLHAYAFYAAVGCAAVLVVLAHGGRALAGAVTYGLGLCALFGVSGAYHRWRGAPRIKRLLRRADHATIFVFIAASYTPVALLALSGSLRWVVLGSAWAGALAGVALSVGWIDAPRWLTAAAYVAADIRLPRALPRPRHRRRRDALGRARPAHRIAARRRLSKPRRRAPPRPQGPAAACAVKRPLTTDTAGLAL